MKRGFSLLELLVASLLLGMLVTILTSVFNQSAIAWRIGTHGVSDMDKLRDNIGEIREEADNVYLWNDRVYRHLSPWTPAGKLRARAIDADGAEVDQYEKANYFRAYATNLRDDSTPEDFQLMNINGNAAGSALKNYTINIMSAGPDRVLDTWDDIWSFPDDFEE